VVLTPEHMALLEQDDEFWAAVSADKPCPPAVGEELTAHGRSMSDRQQKESICLCSVISSFCVWLRINPLINESK
jgi:hypothetical protein